MQRISTLGGVPVFVSLLRNAPLDVLRRFLTRNPRCISIHLQISLCGPANHLSADTPLATTQNTGTPPSDRSFDDPLLRGGAIPSAAA